MNIWKIKNKVAQPAVRLKNVIYIIIYKLLISWIWGANFYHEDLVFLSKQFSNLTPIERINKLEKDPE